MVKKAVEQTGLIPRSIIRTFDRFKKQLFPEAEKLIIQEFRISRYQFLVSIKCLANLIFIPLLVNFFLKNFLLIPITENFWNSQQSDIFLNSYQQDQAFNELKKFQEKLYFDYLLTNLNTIKEKPLVERSSTFYTKHYIENPCATLGLIEQSSTTKQPKFCFARPSQEKLYFSTQSNFLETLNFSTYNEILPQEKKSDLSLTHTIISKKKKNSEIFFLKSLVPESANINYEFDKASPYLENYEENLKRSLKSSNTISDSNQSIGDVTMKKLMKEKILELAVYHNHKSVLAITNLIGDFITFLVINLLIRYMKPQISILKSFLTESIYSLNDTKKSFLLILGTDLLVGFHSPRGWEICLELILRYFGFPENKDFVFLFVASFPVLLDTVFKYWIFRYLNKISPSTVATYHSMIE